MGELDAHEPYLIAYPSYRRDLYRTVQSRRRDRHPGVCKPSTRQPPHVLLHLSVRLPAETSSNDQVSTACAQFKHTMFEDEHLLHTHSKLVLDFPERHHLFSKLIVFVPLSSFHRRLSRASKRAHLDPLFYPAAPCAPCLYIHYLYPIQPRKTR